MKDLTLQHVIIGREPQEDGTQDMFCRTKNLLCKGEDGGYCLVRGGYYDFSTYFNSLSIEKWRKYTHAQNIKVELDIYGKFHVELMGHYVDTHGKIHKEWLGNYYFDVPERRVVTMEFPKVMMSTVVAFQLTAESDNIQIYGGRYFTEVDEKHIKNPRIVMATTTFKKEEYIMKNAKLLNEHLFSNERYRKAFKWIIVDNGRSLDKKAVENDNIKVVENPNVGGSGGFTRGIIEANKQKEKPTNILLMDDDVSFMVDSFRRVYAVLSLIKSKYKDYFISGAMLEMDQRNIQHEDVGEFGGFAEHHPSKERFNLNDWRSVILNEVINKTDDHHYSGWWYCCIPASIARNDNLPLPFFIRGDDVEYSIRNHAKFITMNGICIWHQGFGTKFSAAMELYQVHRNDLILQGMNSQISDIDVIGRMKNLFWEEMYKFNYKGADLILDAIEDYLKGPEFLINLNGEQCMKEKKNKDNTLYPINNKVEALIDREELYNYEDLKKGSKWLYDHTCNGQRMPKFLSKKKIGIIPYGWGYYQKKMYMTTVNYAIDPINNLYAVYRRNDKTFKREKERFNKLIARYNNEHEEVNKKYKSYEEKMTSVEFWNDYLKKQDNVGEK